MSDKMTEAKNGFIGQLIELCKKMIEQNVAIQDKNETGCIIEVCKDIISIKYENGKIKNKKIYSPEYNYNFFECNIINDSQIMNDYQIIKKTFEDKLNQIKIEEANQYIRLGITQNHSKQRKNNYKFIINKASRVGFNAEGFRDFIVNSYKSNETDHYAEGSAYNYAHEIIKILDSGVRISDLCKNIDDFILEYTEGSLSEYNRMQHAKPSSALIMFKKYINRI